MELSPKQQIAELIKKSQKFLIISHQKPGGDSVGAILALKAVLEKIGKEARAVVSEGIPSSLVFLPGVENIKKNVEDSRDLVLEIDLKDIDLGGIESQVEDNKLKLTISPKTGFLTSESVEITDGKPHFDAIFVLDTQDVDKIDRLYDEYTNLFFETPIINIDHHAGNEHFGTINLVDMTATSTSEILVAIFESLGYGKLDEDISTLLLAGITADTGSFKNVSTTPKSLTVAAQLLAAGARQQEIIENFFKKRSLGTLKLWGKILSNINSNADLRVVWSYVKNQDFLGSGAALEEAVAVMDELLSNTPNADVVCLLLETEPNHFTVKLRGVKGSDVLEIAESFGGRGHTLSAEFDLKNVGFEAAQFELLKKIQGIRTKKTGRDMVAENIQEAPKTEVETDEEKELIIEKPEEIAVKEPASVPALSDEKNLNELDSAEDLLGDIEVSSNPNDPIAKAIASLEAAKIDKDPAPEAEKEDKSNLTPLSEIIKNFQPSKVVKKDEIKVWREEK